MSDCDSFQDDGLGRAKTPSIDDEYEEDFEQDLGEDESPLVKQAENKVFPQLSPKPIEKKVVRQPLGHVESQKEMVDRLRHEISGLRQTNRNSTQLEDKIKRLYEQIGKQEKVNQDQQLHFNKQMAEFQVKQKGLLEEVDEVRVLFDGEESIQNTHLESLACFDADIQDANLEIDDLHQKLIKENCEIATLQQEIAGLEQDKNEENIKKQKVQQDLEYSTKLNNTKHQQVQELESKIHSHEQTLQENQEQQAAKTNQVHEISEEYNSLVYKAADSKAQQSTIKYEIKSIEHEIEYEQEKIGKLQDQQQVLINKEKAIRELLDRREIEAQQKEDRKNGLDKQILTIKQETQELNQKVDTLQDKKKAQQQERQALQDHVKTLQKSNIELQAELDYWVKEDQVITKDIRKKAHQTERRMNSRVRFEDQSHQKREQTREKEAPLSYRGSESRGGQRQHSPLRSPLERGSEAKVITLRSTRSSVQGSALRTNDYYY